jgi:glutamine---fructose-6-phosphate transaminase (isomerizing)
MRGIVACAGSGEAIDFLLGGLGRLEYRGYDSAGVAVADPHHDCGADVDRPRNLAKSVTVE